MDKSLAFALGVFPLFLLTFFGLIFYLTSRGLMVLYVSTPANDTFFITFAFSFPLGILTMLLVEWLRKH